MLQNEKPGAHGRGIFDERLDTLIVSPSSRLCKGAMNKLERPILGLDAEYQIEAAQNHIETNYWHQLEEMRVLTPAADKAFGKSFPMLMRKPPMPKSPNGLRRILALYASSLFESEAAFYPSDPQLEHWLRKLAQRIVKRTLETVSRLEEENRVVSLDHHGLTQSQMRETVNAALEEVIKPRLVIASPAAQEPIPKVKRVEPKELTKKRKQFVEPILTDKGWSILDWANEADVAYHTAADYLAGSKNPYRSTRLKLARALGVFANQLPE